MNTQILEEFFTVTLVIKIVELRQPSGAADTKVPFWLKVIS